MKALKLSQHITHGFNFGRGLDEYHIGSDFCHLEVHTHEISSGWFSDFL